MFTGLIQRMGRVLASRRMAGGLRLTVEVHPPFHDLVLGESIAHNGACLTVVDFNESQYSVEVSEESLTKTTVAALQAGDHVNLERALTLSDRLGGHLVAGHVDGIGRLVSATRQGAFVRMAFEAPGELMRQIAYKGSVAIDGVSLTVASVTARGFEVAAIPETLEDTTLGAMRPGTSVNLETDLLAKYVERFLTGSAASGHGEADSLMDRLREGGFIR